jgi:hypothetical protein
MATNEFPQAPAGSADSNPYRRFVAAGENPGARPDEPKPGDPHPWADHSRMDRLTRVQVEAPAPGETWRA